MVAADHPGIELQLDEMLRQAGLITLHDCAAAGWHVFGGIDRTRRAVCKQPFVEPPNEDQAR